MYAHANKKQENRRQSVDNTVSQKQKSSEITYKFVDNRPRAIAQRKLQEIANNSSRVKQLRAFKEIANNSSKPKYIAQLQAIANDHPVRPYTPKNENKTGLHNGLKSGVENLSSSSGDLIQLMPADLITDLNTKYELGFGPNDGRRRALENDRYTYKSYLAFRKWGADLKPLINQNFHNFMRVLQYAENYNNPADAISILTRVNKFFRIGLLTLKNDKTLAEYSRFMDEIDGLNLRIGNYNRTFFQERAQTRDPDQVLVDFINIVDGAARHIPRAETFDLIYYATINRQPISLNAGNIEDAARIYSANPPGGGFAGFARWGEGNHGGSAANLTGHSLKHVFATEGAEYINEAKKWWRILNIRMDYGQLNGIHSRGGKGFQNRDKRNIFGHKKPPNNEQVSIGSPNRVEALLKYSADKADLRTFFGNWENLYGDYIINRSSEMDNRAVHESRDGIFISGNRNDIFIIGRLDSKGGNLGISSGYIADDIASKLDRQILWLLD